VRYQPAADPETSIRRLDAQQVQVCMFSEVLHNGEADEATVRPRS
jgi:hypothetical protein